MPSTVFSPEDIVIEKIRMFTNRFPNGQELVLAGIENDTIEGTGGAPIVSEFSVYENIFKPYTTATMILIDEHDLYRVADIVGTERVEIQFKAPGENNAATITKRFVIRSVEDSVKTNDYTQVLNISLIEDIGFYNDMLNISKSYTGTCEEIIFKIVQDNFDPRTVRFASNPGNISAQKTFRYFAPNVDPFTAISQILEKMTTEHGMPFFFYSSIYEDEFVLVDMHTMISRDPMNSVNGEIKPFVFSQATSNMISDKDLEAKALSVISYEPGRSEDTHLLATRGALSSKVATINASTGEPYEIKFNMTDVMQSLISVGDVPAGQSVIDIDNQFVADPYEINLTKLSEPGASGFQTRQFNYVLGDNFPQDPEIRSFYGDPYEAWLSTTKEHFTDHLVKNVCTIHVPGLLFSFKDLKSSVSNQIAFDVFKNNFNEKETDVVDNKRSGLFVILKKRHIFDLQSKGRHTVVLDIAKLFNRTKTA